MRVGVGVGVGAGPDSEKKRRIDNKKQAIEDLQGEKRTRGGGYKLRCED